MAHFEVDLAFGLGMLARWTWSVIVGGSTQNAHRRLRVRVAVAWVLKPLPNMRRTETWEGLTCKGLLSKGSSHCLCSIVPSLINTQIIHLNLRDGDDVYCKLTLKPNVVSNEKALNLLKTRTIRAIIHRRDE